MITFINGKLEYVKNLAIDIRVVSLKEMHFPISAQWFFEGEKIVIQIVRLGDLDMERVLAMHEISEVLSGAHFPNMDDETTDRIDEEWLELHNSGKLPDCDEPGFYHKSPYKIPHTYAQGNEMGLCAWLGVDWIEYNKRMEEVVSGGKECEF
jgi:hypothetical protein